MTDEPDLEREFSMLLGTRDYDGDAKYQLRGLPEGGNFRDSDDYERIDAGALKVCGVAFSASTFEFGEYETPITVTQQNEGGLTNLSWDREDDE